MENKLSPTPRQILDGLLRGLEPPRPLCLPIVFALGAKLENLPLSAFLGNATKISNSLRQIHSHLRSDGLACYFDPWLEAEALGGRLEWNAEDGRPTLRWPQPAAKGELPADLRAPEDAMQRGRIAVALEVIRRLKSLRRDDALLTAGVTGPFTLAARIMQLESEDSWRSEHFPEAALEVAASLMTQISAAFVAAGANLIFIQEEVLPPLAAESCQAWAARLAPAVNIIRFYQALPVLQLRHSHAFAENREVIFRQPWDCVVCPTLEGALPPSPGIPGRKGLGLALPLHALRADQAGREQLDQLLHYWMSELRPVLLTTAGDIPAGTDLKHLSGVWEGLCDYEAAHPA
jgi:hypothetical protein